MISIVIPVFNEEESLHPLYEELAKALSHINDKYEILFIDDGSTDDSLTILKSFTNNHQNVRVFSFRRNLGKAEALTYGFAKAKGDYIVTLDADLQDQPSEIQKLLEKARKDKIEVVCGWRNNRKDASKMKVISKLFNFIVVWLFELRLHDYNCGLKVFTKDAAKSLRLYGGLHRFIPLIAYEHGFTVDEVPVRHEPRRFGMSKYGFSKLWKDLPDMFTMLFLVKYSKRPLHFFGIVGGVLAFLGILILSYLTVLRFMGERIGTRPLLFFGMLLVLAGFQVFFTGFLADLMINISHAPGLLDEQNLHFPLKYTSDKN